jgi:hypothetical protein
MRMNVLISPLPALSSTFQLGEVGLALAACCPGAGKSLSNY